MRTLSQTPVVHPVRRSGVSLALCFALAMIALPGCNRFHQVRHETVYVSARQMYLHDRVAPVSNRTAEVTNGQPLEVLELGRRFLKVKTQKNEIGWIEDRAVISSPTFDAFQKLATDHKQDPVIASAVVRDDLYLHMLPGRDAEHFYLLAANTKVQLLDRASVPKPAPGAPSHQAALQLSTPPKPPTPAPAAKPVAKPPAPSESALPPAQAPSASAPAPVILEDWWLVRDPQGHTGWLLASRLDVDVPDEIGAYAEGQRYIGVYVLTKVVDPEASTPNHEVPEYLTVLGPPRSGLPFDFDQVRVYTWSLKHHRYETAFRLHPIQGFFPVRSGVAPGPGGSVPVFSFQISSGQNVTVDPATGVTHPANPRTINYEMLDTVVKRIGPDMGPIPIVHTPEEIAKAKAKAEKAAKKKSR